MSAFFSSEAARRVQPRLTRPGFCVPPGARGLTLTVMALLLAGCATGDPVHTLDKQRGASQREPTNAQAQLDYIRQRERVVNGLLDDADRLRVDYRFDEAVKKLDEASKLDPHNERGRKLAAAVELDGRDATILHEAMRLMSEGSWDAAAERVRRVRAENPTNVAARQLSREIEAHARQQRVKKEERVASDSIMRKPVTLQFRDANVRMVFEALSRTSGLNVIFDRDVRADLKTTIFVSNASIEDTVDLILLQNQLEKKVLNGNTLFVYPATAAKQREYQELKVRTFQLSNIEAKQVQSLLKSLLKIKEVIVDERANTVSIRDTPEAIRVAEQMIAAQDLPEPEVMLEVQVLEVARDRVTDLGIAWPTSFSVATPLSVATFGDLRKVTRDALAVSGLSATANFKLTDTDANLLASPRIRTRNKEKAKILIGDKVPVISSSSTPSTSGPSYSQSIQYLDVGIKLEVEPQVYVDDDVGIKLNLEVSNITSTISSSNAQTGLSSLAYQIGTRSASTSLRLKDGETQILGGLIQDEDRDSADKVPGVGQLPVVGRLFSNHNGNHKKTEIVLQITPHIIRPQLSADVDVREVWSGTDGTVRSEQLRLDPTGAANGATVVSSAGPAVVPGHVGGGTLGGPAGAAPAGSAVVGGAPGQALSVPRTGSFGQAPAAPRTTPPAAPFGGRYSTIPMAPRLPAPEAPAATAAPAPEGAAEAAAPAAVTPVIVPVAPVIVPVAPMAVPAAPPIVVMPPGAMPSENPLHPVPTGGY